MTEIVPAVLAHSYEELNDALANLKGVAKTVQVDVVADIFGIEEAMPWWEDFDFEFDVLMEHPEAMVRRCIELGASSIVVHARHPGAREALEMLQDGRDGDFAVRVGLGLAVTDSLEALEPFRGLYDLVQVMGIAHIGKQGEPFDPRAIDLVRALRAAHPEFVIQVDGGVGGHEQELAAAGANRLVIGSAIVRSDAPRTAYQEAQARANGGVY